MDTWRHVLSMIGSIINTSTAFGVMFCPHEEYPISKLDVTGAIYYFYGWYAPKCSISNMNNWKTSLNSNLTLNASIGWALVLSPRIWTTSDRLSWKHNDGVTQLKNFSFTQMFTIPSLFYFFFRLNGAMVIFTEILKTGIWLISKVLTFFSSITIMSCFQVFFWWMGQNQSNFCKCYYCRWLTMSLFEMTVNAEKIHL